MLQMCPAAFTDNQFRGEGDACVFGGALDGLDQGADDQLSPAAAVVMDWKSIYRRSWFIWKLKADSHHYSM